MNYERQLDEWHRLKRAAYVKKYGLSQVPRKTDDEHCFTEAVACRANAAGQQCKVGNRYQVKIGRAKQTCLGETPDDLIFWLHPDGCKVINKSERVSIRKQHPTAKFSEQCPTHRLKHQIKVIDANTLEEPANEPILPPELAYPTTLDKKAYEGKIFSPSEYQSSQTQLQLTKFRGKKAQEFQEAISTYTHQEFDLINSSLRGNLWEPLSQEEELLVQKHVVKLDEAFLRVANVIESPTTLFRGLLLDKDRMPRVFEAFESQRKCQMKEKAFLSTTVFVSTAMIFAKPDYLEEDQAAVVLAITIETGTPYIATTNFSDSHGEWEILLPRNLTLVLRFDRMKNLISNIGQRLHLVPAQVRISLKSEAADGG